MDMAFQPNNCSEDVSENSDIDFVRMVFDGYYFNHVYNNLTLRPDNGLLNTPDLQITNRFIPSNSGSQIDSKNDVPKTDFQEAFSMDCDKEQSVASEAVDEEIIALLLAIEPNVNNMNSNIIQHATTNERQAIEAIENDLRNSLDELRDFQAVLNAMKRDHPHPTMTMRVQPLANQRIRYLTDDQRYLKGSRTRPMSINLPRLDGCLTRPSQSFWIQMTLVTTQQNPNGKTFYHQHRMIYIGENAEWVGLQSFRIPVTDEEIHRRVKQFRYLSIIKTKQVDYDFQLIPFDPLIADDHVVDYTVENDDQLTQVQKSKLFDQAYHTEDFRIVSQLLIRQNDQWYTTDLYCQTHVIHDN